MSTKQPSIKEMLEKATSKSVRKLLEDYDNGDKSKKQVVTQLTGYMSIPSKTSLKPGVSADEYMKAYRDTLLILPIIKGERATLTNANVTVANRGRNNVNAAFRSGLQTRKVANANSRTAARTERKETQKRERAINAVRRKLQALETGAPVASAARTPTKKNARVAALRATHGRAPEKAASIAAKIASISLAKTPAYIKQITDRIESQVHRFSAKDKESTMASMRKKIRELKGDLEDKTKTGKLKAGNAEEYSALIDAMERLYTIVEEETNVEVSASAKTSRTSTRGKSTGPMSCRILHHPCNPKIKISADQLTEAAISIAETGKAPRIPASEMISQASSAMTSAATSAAVSPE